MARSIQEKMLIGLCVAGGAVFLARAARLAAAGVELYLRECRRKRMKSRCPVSEALNKNDDSPS